MVSKNPTKEKKIVSNSKVVCCSGGESNMGHPAVYYNFGDKEKITCQYCGTIFIKSK